MAAPAIILRFRDTTPGVDTIVEHRAILSEHGLVAWGWWKKTFEDAQTEKILRRFATEGELYVSLLDHSTGRQFLCRCVEFQLPEDVSAELVPEYYRAHANMTAGFFILGSIDDMLFDQDLADAIDDMTFLWAGEQADEALGHKAPLAHAPGRRCVLHLSDLHFGSDYGFRRQGEDVEIGDPRKTLTECISADLERLKIQDEIAAVIVTGDFMTRGKFDDESRQAALDEFSALRDCLGLEREQIIAVPGNHDVIRYPEGGSLDIRENAVGIQTRYEHETLFRTFADELVGRDWKASLNYSRRINLGDVDLDVCVLNSCTIAATEWTEYGYVGRSGLEAIEELEAIAIERPTFRFIALHHHLLPVARVEALNAKGVSLTLDSSDILAAGQKSKVHIALHGHQHKPKVAMYQNVGLNGDDTHDPIFVVANGSAGVKNERLPPGECNTYCVFKLSKGGIEMWIRELRLNGQCGMETYAGPLPLKPLTPQFFEA